MDMWKTKSLRATLALLSALVVLMAGMVLFESDSSDAAITADGNLEINVEGTPTVVGTWVIEDSTLLRIVATTDVGSTFPVLVIYDSSYSTSITDVSVKGIKFDVTSNLASLSITSATVQYTGDMPTTTQKSGGGTQGTYATGIWTYDVSSKTINFNRTGSTYYSLTSYESANIDTEWKDYWFTSVAETATITGEYRNGGDFVYHDFTNLTTLHADTHTSLNTNMLAGIGFKHISMNNLIEWNNGSFMQGNNALETLSLGSAKSVSGSAFKNCSHLTSVSIGYANLASTVVYNHAFNGCTSLQTVQVLAKNVTLDYNSFYGCTSLNKVTITSEKTTISNNVFELDDSLVEVFLGSGPVSVGSSAFSQCTKLVKLNLDNLTTCENASFYKTSIGTYNYDYEAGDWVAVGDGYYDLSDATRIGAHFNYYDNPTGAFMDCDDLVRIKFVSLNTIGNRTFENCLNLKYVDFNSSSLNGNLGSRIFYNCPELVTIEHLSITGVQYVGNEAFRGCAKLTELTFPNTLSTIYGNAFYGLGELTTVNAGTGLKTISNDAFRQCSKLTTFTCGNALETVGNNVFYGCSKLVAFNGGTALQSIGSYCFNGCSELQSFTAGDGLTTINSYAFDGCTALATVTIGDKLDIINEYAFRGCTSLVDIDAGNSLRIIYRQAFENCIHLKTFTCGESLEYIKYRAFYKCNELESFVGHFTSGTPKLPTWDGDPAGTIDNEAFLECIALVTADFGNYQKKIDSTAFKSCINLVEYNTGSNLELISSSAFNGCSKLEHVGMSNDNWVFPDTLTEIGSSAFVGTSLRSVAFNAGSHLQYIRSSAFEGTPIVGTVLVDGTSVNGIRFPDTLQVIENYAFKNCSNLQGIILSETNTLNTINYQAFYNCDLHGVLNFTGTLMTLGSSAFYQNTNLAGVKFSETTSLETVPDSCFSGCTNLATIHLFGSIKTIGTQAFQKCNGSDLQFGQKIQTIGWQSFYQCNGMETLIIPASCKTIRYQAFYDIDTLLPVDLGSVQSLEPYSASNDLCQTFAGCARLQSVNLGTSLTTIYNHTFDTCPSLRTVTWSPVLYEIKYRAFYDCDALETAIFPDTLRIIGSEAFRSCGALTTVDLNKVTSLGTGAFIYCSNLQSLDLGDNLTEIPKDCFNECYHLESIIFPPNLTTIGENAFRYLCVNGSTVYGLKTLIIPDTVTSIGRAAFYNCRALTDLTVGKSVTTMGPYCFAVDNGTRLALSNLTVPINLNLADYTSDANGWPFQGRSDVNTIHFTTGLNDGAIVTDGFDYIATKGTKYYQYTPMYLSATQLEKVIIDADITSLGDYNLCFTTTNLKLSDLTIPIRLKTMDSSTSHNFEFVDRLQNVTFIGTNGLDYSLDPSDELYIGKTPWYKSTALSMTVTFSSSVKTIGKNMFYNGETGLPFSKVKTLVLDGTNTVTKIGENAFYNCSGITSDITLNNIVTLENMCFNGTRINSITFGAGLVNIGDRSLLIPGLSSITVDVANPLFSSNGDEHVLYGQNSGTLISLEKYPALKTGSSYTIPSSVLSVKPYAAYGTLFTELTIPALTSTIGEYAFDSGSLTTLNINSTPQSCGLNAFGHMATLSTVSLPIKMPTANVFSGSNNISSYTFWGTGPSGLSSTYYRDNAAARPWANTTSVDINVVFSSGITAIDNYMFAFDSDSATVTSITIPNGCRSIGTEAFKNCIGLTTLTLPDTINALGTDCFSGCHSIGTFNIPVSLNFAIDPNHNMGIISPLIVINYSAGSGAGYNYSTDSTASDYYGNIPWSNITGFTVKYKSGVTSTGDNLYFRVSSVEFSDTLTTVGDHAFYDSTMSTVDLKNVREIRDNAFGSCDNIVSLSLPAALSQYLGKPFQDCTQISTVTLPINLDYSAGIFDGCINISNYTFIAGTASAAGWKYTEATSANTPWVKNLENDKSPVLTFSSGITEIGECMFYKCDRYVSDTLTYGIDTVVLPSSVVSVKRSAFEGCAYISTLTFTGQNISVIGASAFKGCANLTSLEVGSDTVFGAGAFNGCNKLATLAIPMTSDAVVKNSDPVFTTTVLSSLTFKGQGEGFDYSDNPESGSYYQLTPWYKSEKTINWTIGSGITSIGDNMFRGCAGLKFAVTLPDSIVEIRNSSFMECAAITYFNANKVTKIGTHAFDSSSVVGVTMPLLTVVKDYAFYNCKNLSTATLNACNSIGAHAFQDSTITGFNASGTIDLTNVTVIGEEAFAGCTLIEGDVTVDDNLAAIGAGAFKDCAKVVGLSGDLTHITSIGGSAFEGCVKFG